MDHLQYKGWKSTRVLLGIILGLMVTGGWMFGDVSAEQWIEFLKWDFGIFALSEIGAKGAVAVRERGHNS